VKVRLLASVLLDGDVDELARDEVGLWKHPELLEEVG
jgi:hypothetical protein